MARKGINSFIFYNGKRYDMVSPDSLNEQQDFGFSLHLAGTENPREYSCSYSINKDKIRLEEISGYLQRPKPIGWFNKLIYSIKRYPPNINGVSPLFYVLYEDLDLPVKYSGDLVIGVAAKDAESGIDINNPFTFSELIRFTIDSGMVIAKEVTKGRAPSPGII